MAPGRFPDASPCAHSCVSFFSFIFANSTFVQYATLLPSRKRGCCLLRVRLSAVMSSAFLYDSSLHPYHFNTKSTNEARQCVLEKF